MLRPTRFEPAVDDFLPTRTHRAVSATVATMTAFEPDVVAAILAHMNNDHPEDNLVIVRAFGAPDAERAVMIDLDTVGGTWTAWLVPEDETVQVVVPWPAGTIETRGEIRREIVALYDAASSALGLPARDHVG
ncbi:MAG: hypothetical protein JWR01_414 [Subtercola sp.]|nr:hypothetical protein [Subtercola sp.]